MDSILLFRPVYCRSTGNQAAAVVGGPIAETRYWAVDPFRHYVMAGDMCVDIYCITPAVCP